MSYRRYNVSQATGNFTGVTTGATINGSSLHVGENQRDVQDLVARVVATVTMTNATMKTQWQGSNDATTWDSVALSSENPANTAFITGAASGTVIGVPAPPTVYGYKYARAQILWTSTTAGTTNDAVTIGYNYRQLEVGSGQ